MHVDTPGLVFFAGFAVLLGIFAYRILKYGGWKAAMFGGCIERTVGEVRGTGQGGNVKLRVHALSDDSEDRAVGIELVATTIGSYQMLPITRSAEGVQKLIGLLQESITDAT
jgi:hypothetical protein